jgi:uncharacterized protein (TIGR03790 family)
MAARLIAVVLLVPPLVAGCNGDDPSADVLLADARPADARPADTRPAEPDGPPLPEVELPRSSILPAELGLIVNEDDPRSKEIASYYAAARGIPAANLITVKLPTTAVVDPAVFKPIKAQVDAATPPGVQAYALTWMLPYRVGCMSITSAFALGHDPKYCNDPALSGQSCSITADVPYFMKESTRPFTDFGIRPTMALAGVDAKQVKALVDRGLAAGDTLPPGKGYLIRTTDAVRSDPRYEAFQTSLKQLDHPGGVELEYIDNSQGPAEEDVISGKKDVLFYFTGLTHVPKLETNTYRPGAVADHLTSVGGVLSPPGSGGQMSVLRWLEAGVTGSYGTVVEPCNMWQKFPDTRVLLPYYFRGNTLVEAYWKSVKWPGEGIFVGDPLARPFGTRVTRDADSLTIRTTILMPLEDYELRGLDPKTGKMELIQKLRIDRFGLVEITIKPIRHTKYRLGKGSSF